MLNKEELIASIYVCALELILFTYESEREFPWSLEVIRLAPVHFYKAIELVIRAEPELSREMVKHLNKVCIYACYTDQSVMTQLLINEVIFKMN